MLKRETVLMDNCEHHKQTECKGDIICQDCGLVLDKSIQNKFENIKYNQHQHPSARFYSFPNSLGSVIGGTILDKKYSRLKKHSKYIPYKDKHTYYRSLQVLDTISRALKLPRHIKQSAILYYNKIDPEIIKNHIVCACFCLWNSIKIYNYPIPLKELFIEFRKRGHSANAHLLNKISGLYSKYLNKNGFKKPKSRTPIIYLPRIVSSLKENKSMIEERLIKKAPGIYKNIEHYLIELELFCLKNIEKLKSQSEKRGHNPVNYAGAVVYFSDLLMALKNNHKAILTLKILSNSSGVANYSMRDIYTKHLRPYYLKELRRISNIEEERGFYNKKRYYNKKVLHKENGFFKIEGNHQLLFYRRKDKGYTIQLLHRYSRINTIKYPPGVLKSDIIKEWKELTPEQFLKAKGGGN